MGKKRGAFGKVSVKIPIYNIDTELYIGEGSIPSTLPIEPEGRDGCVQVVSRGGYRKVVVWMSKMEWKTRDIGLLAHELIHAVERVFEIIGIEERPDEEFIAYLMGFLMREYCKKIYEKWFA